MNQYDLRSASVYVGLVLPRDGDATFGDASGECLDAPDWIPAGSSRMAGHVYIPDEPRPTAVWREALR